MSDIVELDDDLGATVRKKIANLQQLDESIEKRKKKPASEVFAMQCMTNHLPPFARETKFAEAIKRNWRFDFSWRKYMVAVEIEGLVMMRTANGWQVGGRHGTISGFKLDAIKYNTAALLGWTVLRFEQSMVASGHALRMTMRVLARRGFKPQS